MLKSSIIIYFLIFIFIMIYSSASPSSSSKYILHLTDVHLDPFYSPNTPTDCLQNDIEMRCCHIDSIPVGGNTSSSSSSSFSNTAGYWGDFNCDTPYRLLENTIDWILISNITIDYIVFSGDTPGHHFFASNWPTNYNTLYFLTKQLSRLDKPIFAVLGNHDTFLVDQLYSVWPVINNTKDLWENQTLMHGSGITNFYPSGAYASKNIGNWAGLNCLWLDSNNLLMWIMNNTDIYGQLKFLEKNINQSTIFISHFGPGTGEAEQIFENFLQNITPAFMFSGHTHQDEIRLILPTNTTAGYVTYIAPSFMPDNHNPTFRIYEVENYISIINYKQYILNLTLQNQQETSFIGYTEFYDAKYSYDLPNFSLEAWIDFSKRLSVNDTLLSIFCYHLTVGETSICNKKSILCDINPAFC